MKKLSILTLFVLFICAWTRTAEEWKTRVLYQIVTDRFAVTGDDVPVCENLFKYCGGTWKGIEKELDYIQGMGFNAIWISPVNQNGEDGYHGYWLKNFYEVNENFGTKQDLHDLIDACHARDMWVMVDMVPNHVTPHIPQTIDNETNETIFDFSGVYPFNDKSHYHFPIIQCADIFKNDPTNASALELCWLWRLPDLNHENEEVTRLLLEWIKDFIETYKVDGLRLDANRHYPKEFSGEFSKAAGVFTIGEVFHDNLTLVADYQGVVDSLLNFPLQNRLEATFRKGENMTLFSKYYKESGEIWKDMTVLGNFVSNHDIVRFLYNNSDIPGFKASYAFVFASIGIPSMYYGDEQLLDGGIDPENRETLWGKLDRNGEMYQYIKKINEFRTKNGYYHHEQTERLSDEEVYAFSRGDVFFAFTNTPKEQVRTITSHQYKDNTKLCNALNPDACTVVKNGAFDIHIKNKEVLFLHPVGTEDEKGISSVVQGVKEAISQAIPHGTSK